MTPTNNYINELKESARKKRLKDLLKLIADAESSKIIQLPPFVKKTEITNNIEGVDEYTESTNNFEEFEEIDENAFYVVKKGSRYKYEFINIEEISDRT